MESYNSVKEDTRHQCRGIRVSQRQEMGGLREPVDNREYDGFAVDAREPLNEVHDHVGPNDRRQLQRLQQAGRMKLLRLVVLTSGAHLDEVQYCPVHARNMEVRPEPV
jgi:hypothetical protein